MQKSVLAAAALLTTCWWGAIPVQAHHSYAMFDATKKQTVSGTVAKWGWQNPHSYLWVYVENDKAESGHDLYAFENGSTNVLSRLGWTKSTVTAGDKISIEYYPLKDGRTGGHFIQITLANGQVMRGAGGPGPATQFGIVPSESEVKQ